MLGEFKKPELCKVCLCPHPGLIDCLSAQRNQIQKLLLLIAPGFVRCDCGVHIVWIKNHETGKRIPVTLQGVVHFDYCTGRFSREKPVEKHEDKK